MRKNRHKRFFPACGALRLSRATVHRFRRIGRPEKPRQATPPGSSGQCSPRLAADALTGYKPYSAR
ncbi:hypothetical protein HMPREF1619_04721 [Klebsiella pneumoniae 909957]|nr:hypothetical protein HMPREF1619_04721 [Klebsiella pneumoniae 909957]